ncbi:hypothetical protein [Parasphingorhabdus sp.]|uniref:hypothetical protein n=1 Tax=Parasphingorhabdus sp. TaxID=2709688 RepID=UPI0030A07404
MTGLSVSQVAYAVPLSVNLQAAAADARADVKIESSIMVERTEESETGETVSTLLDPANVKIIPSDKLLFTNSYRNISQNDVTGFLVNNPVHKAVTFVEALEDWPLGPVVADRARCIRRTALSRNGQVTPAPGFKRDHIPKAHH